MNVSGINNVLPSAVNKSAAAEKSEFNFKDVINQEIDKINNKWIEADKLTQGFMAGDVNNLHSVLIATDEARLSLELAIQVRNKVIESYKEIINMQL